MSGVRALPRPSWCHPEIKTFFASTVPPSAQDLLRLARSTSARWSGVLDVPICSGLAPVAALPIPGSPHTQVGSAALSINAAVQSALDLAARDVVRLVVGVDAFTVDF